MNNSKPTIEDCRDYLQCCYFAEVDGIAMCNHFVREGGSAMPHDTLKVCPDDFEFEHMNDEEHEVGPRDSDHCTI